MKNKVTVIFGEYAAKAYVNDGVEGIRDHYDEDAESEIVKELLDEH